VVTPPLSAWVFLGAVALLAAQRLWELRRSVRNEARLRARGAVEAAPGQMPWMRALHAGWLVAMPLEVFLLGRPFIPALAVLGLVGLVAGQALRYAAIRSLEERWTVRVLVLPGGEPVTGGVYRYVRHPNYVGVALEIAFVPLLHSAWVAAVVFSLLNAALLRARIRAEERALSEAEGYALRLGARPRFVPRPPPPPAP
jgi:methyltransferase